MGFQERVEQALAGRFRIDNEIARGGMGIVYRAHDTARDDEVVALKVMRPEFAVTLAEERFLREMQIAQRLKHHNIVPVYDAGTANGLLYYASKFIGGGTLESRLAEQKSLPIVQALDIACQIGEALEYASHMGVLHRDLKPSNILLQDDRAMLSDFGLALAAETSSDSSTASGVFVGTPAYMSPEQGAGSVDLDIRSDIYSLACVLYHMLVGEPPFGGYSPQLVIARHLSEPVPNMRVARKTIPLSVQQVVERSLSKTPADRYQTPRAFVDDVQFQWDALLAADQQIGGGDRRRKVFIGHGRAAAWRDLKDFLQERLDLEWDEFNREATPGSTTVERLQEMLDAAGFAFLVFTAEDEHSDGSLHARENVVHEAGLFQGHLGFRRAIVLLEDGCESLSNIHGLTVIRFPKDQILARTEEIRGVLEREGLLGERERRTKGWRIWKR